MPKRAVIATFLTTVALALLLSFKTPQAAGLGAIGANQAPGVVGTPAAAGAATRATARPDCRPTARPTARTAAR